MTKPNILFVMDDQHRYDFIGADFVRTPHIDQLAARGVRFTHCCVNAPVCAPSRIGLASGLQPSRLGALNNQAFLPQHITTYYQRLRAANFQVGLVGKLDLAKPDSFIGHRGERPWTYGLGFTHPHETEGKMNAGNVPEGSGPYTHFLQERGLAERFQQDYAERQGQGWIRGMSHDSVLPEDAFHDSYIGQQSVNWIEQVNADFPWHLFVSFVGPHDPFDPPTTYAERTRDAAVPAAIEDDLANKPAWVKKRALVLSPDEIAHTRRQYCASIELIDDWIGRILAAVEQRGMLQNTVVIFASDHGEMLGDHSLYQKSVAYEAALRVPLVIAGPGIPQGQVCDALVELNDLNPTICEMAGLSPQPDIDARSLGPVLRGHQTQHRMETISVLDNFQCIRTTTHKLIRNQNDVTELYNLVDDPQELVNIAHEQLEMVNKLSARLRERLTEGQWRR